MYGNNRFGNDGANAPVEVGEELDVTIEAVGEKGDGIAKKDGFVLFIPNVNEGDNVRIKVNKVLKKVGFADVVGEAQASEDSQEEKEESDSEPEISEEDMQNDSEDFGEETEEETSDEEDEERQ
ncbi:MAG: TRAM domain-containing protein [Nanobdellota archaeon]